MSILSRAISGLSVPRGAMMVSRVSKFAKYSQPIAINHYSVKSGDALNDHPENPTDYLNDQADSVAADQNGSDDQFMSGKSDLDHENMLTQEFAERGFNDMSIHSDKTTAARRASAYRKPPTKTLFLGNLPWTVTDVDLKDFVDSYSKVYSSRIIFDRFTGRSRGFGYVEVDSNDITGLIEKLQGVVYKGRALRVNEADSEPSKNRKYVPNSGYSRNNQNSIMTNRPSRDRFHNPMGNSQVDLSEEQVINSNKSFF